MLTTTIERVNRDIRDEKLGLSDVVLSAIFVAFFIFALAFVGYSTSHYRMSAVVIDVDKETNLLTLVDICGEEWDYEIDESTQDLKCDDIILVTYDTRGTDNRVDDTITKIKKQFDNTKYIIN